MKKFIRSTNDFVLGAAFLALGLFCLLSPDIAAQSMTQLGGTMAKASTYIRLLGGILTGASAALLVSSMVGRQKEKKPFSFSVTPEALITAAALIVYCLVMPICSFFPATFVLVLGLNLLYKRRENKAAGSPTDTGTRLRSLAGSAAYAAAVTVLFWFVFTRLLSAVLP